MKLAWDGSQLLPLAAMAHTKSLIRTNPARLDGMSPFEVAAALRHLPDLVFFDTAGNLPSTAARPVSIIAARPTRVLRGSIHRQEDRALLRNALNDGPPSSGDHGFPLGGLCGWVDYEGEFVFGDFAEMLVFNHANQTWREIGDLSASLRPSADEATELGPFHAKTSRDQFLHSVCRIKEWIGAGDIYQVNLAQTFEAEMRGGSLFGLYGALRDASPAPMAAWLSLDGREVLCSSPETFH
jgi:hypothetical protein